MALESPLLQKWLERQHNRQQSFLSHEIQRQIQRQLAHTVLRQQVQEVSAAEVFSIIVDETTDASQLEQMSLCVRYVTDDLTAEERFLGLYSADSTKGETLARMIEDALKRLHLPITGLRGQCYDGASNMAGQFQGVQARMKAAEPRAVYVHCTAHRLNLVVKDCLDGIPELRDAIHQAADLIGFYRDSPKRLINLASMGASTALRPLCQTRWTCSEGALASVIENYAALQESLQEVAADTSGRSEAKAKASGFASRMDDFSFFYGVSLALRLLRMTTPVMRAVQGGKQTVSGNLALLAGLSNALAGQREKHAIFWAEVVEQAASLGVEEPKLRRPARPPRRLDSGSDPSHPKTPEDRYRRLFVEAVDRLQRAISCRYGDASSDDEVLATGERALLTGEDAAVRDTARFYGLSEPRLKLHIDMMHDLARGKKLTSLQDVVDFLLEGGGERRILLEECAGLAKLLLTAPATSCTAERSFSLLRRLKSWLRTTMSQERLNHAAVLATYAEQVMELDREALLRDFISGCPSRARLFGSVCR